MFPGIKLPVYLGMRAVVSALALCVVLFASSSSSHAATATANLTVQITITASCTIGAATLNFGSSSGTTLIASAVTASTTVSVQCTNGSPYSIGMDNGQNASGSQRRMVSSGNFINYNLYVDAARLNAWTTASSSTACTTANSCALGTGNGASQTVNIYGTVPAVGSAPAAGSYSDTVIMTITY